MNTSVNNLARSLIASCLVLTLLSCASTSRSGHDYKTLSEIVPSASYSTSVSDATNETIISGNGNALVISAGISGFALNGEWHDLNDRPIYRDGQLHVTRSDAGVIQRALSRSRSSDQTDRSEPEPADQTDAFTVVVDPGHGGKYVGAEGIHGTPEKELNLSVARYLREYMDGRNVNVKLTRSSDSSLSPVHERDLDQRVQIADRIDADLFISIHANAARTNSAKGYEVFISSGDDRRATIDRLRDWYASPDKATTTNVNGYSSYSQMYRDHRRKSRRLARLINGEFRGIVPTGSRGVKEKSLHVLRNAPCPAVLVELGFMTNPREAQLLQRSSYQRKLAKNIAQAVQTFRGSLAHNNK